MEIQSFFETKVALTAKDLGQDIKNLDLLLESKIRTQFEGRCSRNGYVIPNSVKLLSRSIGMIEKGRFTGDIIFYTEAESRVLQPPDGVIVEGEVTRKNKMGIYVNYKDAIRIMIPRDLHIGDDDFEAIQVGETVEVEIKKSRYQVNDTNILSVGVYRSRKAALPAAPIVSPVAVDEQKVVAAEADAESERKEDTDEEVDADGTEA
jgi:DNA-directed RNA polymerase subunit E'/Rpb7